MTLLERIRDSLGPLCPVERHVKQSMRALRPDEEEEDLLMDADRAANWWPADDRR